MTGFSWELVANVLLIPITLILTWKSYLESKSEELRNSIEDAGEAVLPKDRNINPSVTDYSPLGNASVDFRFLERASTSRGAEYNQGAAYTTPWAPVNADIDTNQIQEIEDLCEVRGVSLVREDECQELRVVFQSTDVGSIQSETEKILEIIDRGEW